MQKGGVFSNFLVVLQIILVLSITFSFSFIISSSFVSAQDTTSGSATTPGDIGSIDVVEKASAKGGLNLPKDAGPVTNIRSNNLESAFWNFEGKRFDFSNAKAIPIEGGNIQITDQLGNSATLTPDEFSKLQKLAAQNGVSLTKEKTFEVFGTTLATGGWAHLLEGVSWALAVAGAVQLVGNLAGLDQKLTNTISIAAVAGIMTYKGIASLGQSGFGFLNPGSFFLEYAGLIGIGVAAVTFVLLYKDTSQKYVQFQCLPFEAPLGGQSCEECNKDPLKPCSEYRCRALGQACGIVNEGTKEEKCVWISPDDVKSPIIQAWEDALTEGYSYTPDNAIRPPNRGVKIVNDLSSNQCVKPFTPLQFGITTDEPSRCKIDYIRTDKLDDMQFFFGESNLFSTNHTQTLRLPSPTSINNEAPELQNDGIYSLSVRCQDANGNENVDEFVFNFCVDPSPDTTPPLIEDSSIRSGSPVSFGAQNINISILVDEPAECKWSTQDKDYDSMENAMTCSTKVYQQNAQQLYPCATKLTGIVDKKANDFYFRCKDQPSKPDNERNVNAESYKLTLLGSQPLNIIDFSPNETITGSTDVVKINLQVETSNGAEEGKSVCYFSPSGEKTSYIQMFETNDAYHKQELNLPSGNYKYSFRCIDAGGNSDEAQTEFTVFTDRQAPKVTRAYKEGADALKLVTNEEAKCTYSINNCNFNINEGLAFIYADQEDKKEHFARWNPSSTYYIRCSDEFGNEPATNSCSLIASATNVF